MHAQPVPAAPAVRPLALLLVALSLAGCSVASTVVGPRTWTATLTRPDGSSQTVTVHDESGRLTNAEIDPAGVQPVIDISNPAGEANVVIVPWAGGSCDLTTDLTFTAAGQGLAGTIRTTTTGDVCDMMATMHQVRLTSGTPLPAAQVSLNPAP